MEEIQETEQEEKKIIPGNKRGEAKNNPVLEKQAEDILGMIARKK